METTIKLDEIERELLIEALERIWEPDFMCARDRFTAAGILERLQHKEYPVTGKRIMWADFRYKYGNYYDTIDFYDANGEDADAENLRDDTIIRHWYIHAGHAQVELM